MNRQGTSNRGTAMLDRYPRRDGLYRLSPEAVTIYDRYQKRLVQLDALGSEIWLRMDGVTNLRSIAADIAGQRHVEPDSLTREVIAITGILVAEGIAYLELKPEPLPYHLTLPRESQDPELADASLRDHGWEADQF